MSGIRPRTTRPTVICEFDVVVVPFPFVDLPIRKARPALVFSGESFNAGNGHTVLAVITTGAGSSWPSDIEIADDAAAGLAHRSVIRWKLFTLPNRIILRRVGTLGPKDQARREARSAPIVRLKTIPAVSARRRPRPFAWSGTSVRRRRSGTPSPRSRCACARRGEARPPTSGKPTRPWRTGRPSRGCRRCR
jgi:mRNA interferase MazF